MSASPISGYDDDDRPQRQPLLSPRDNYISSAASLHAGLPTPPDYAATAASSSLPRSSHHSSDGGGLCEVPYSGDDNGEADDDSGGEEEASEEETAPTQRVALWTIVCILSTSFSYGCILTTLFMITLPLECERIHRDHPDQPTSVALGVFVSLAGVTQLVSPLVGRWSDTYVPPAPHELGRRLPYLVLGSVCTIAGLLGQLFASWYGFWMRYSLAFFLHMIGLNIMYAMMIALIPDQIPRSQTGVANGILALELVLGSLFGFALFHSFLYERIQNMYGLYICLVVTSSILTGTHAHDRDAELAYQRVVAQQLRRREGPQRPASPPAGRPKWHRAARKAAQHATHVLVLTPTLILKSVLVDPVRKMDWDAVQQSYWINVERYHDFAVVTLSRLFYYCGMSVQTFFLYYVQDVVGITRNPQAVVATLAMVGQVAGAVTCIPVGYLSDHCPSHWGCAVRNRRTPFVYAACAVLSAATLSLQWIRSLRQLLLCCSILGAANGVYITMDTTLAVDTLPQDDDGDGTPNDSGSAQLLGVWGVAAFLGATLGPLIGGPLLYLIGHQDPGDRTSLSGEAEREVYSLAGYAVLLSLSSTYFLLSALTLRYLRGPIDSATIDDATNNVNNDHNEANTNESRSIKSVI